MNVLLRPAATGLLLAWIAISSARGEEPLRTVSAIRSLPSQIAAKGLPVKVRGVVTFLNPDFTRDFVVHDGTEGIYVSCARAKAVNPIQSDGDYEPGSLVEVEGVTGPGDFAPLIEAKRVQTLGKAEAPKPLVISVPEQLTGALDCQEIAVRGVIQRIERLPESPPYFASVRILVSVLGGGHFVCSCTHFEDAESEPLLDAEVELRGTALSIFNRRGESVGLRLQMNDSKAITVLSPPPAGLFDKPEVSLENLRRFSRDTPAPHRQRTSGIVTFSQPSGFFYLQRGDRAVRVSTSQTNRLEVGDRVEVAGFIEVAQYYAEIREAAFRKIGTGPTPEPVPITWDIAIKAAQPSAEVRSSDLDGQLVRIEGKIERVDLLAAGGPVMWIDHDGHSIATVLPPKMASKAIAKWTRDSQVAVIGICVMTFNASWPALEYPRPTGFRILLRSPGDVIILHGAPWWTAARLRVALLVTGGVLVLALGWAGLLGRAIQRQTQRLAAEIRAKHDAEVEFKATSRERARLAADLHDTLEQGLTAAALQFEVARAHRDKSPAAALEHTELACEVLDRCRDDVRRSIWALRLGILEGRSFAEAIRELTDRTKRVHNLPCECSIQDEGTRVLEFEANHLLLLVQEAVSNALKHGGPSRLAISATIKPERATVTVTDDGCGFTLDQAPGSQQGHFGLLGMRERMNMLGGTLAIHTAPGKGTRIEASVPLNRPPVAPDDGSGTKGSSA